MTGETNASVANFAINRLKAKFKNPLGVEEYVPVQYVVYVQKKKPVADMETDKEAPFA